MVRQSPAKAARDAEQSVDSGGIARRGLVWYREGMQPGINRQAGTRRALIIVVHVALWTAAYFLAFDLRFDFETGHKYTGQMLR